MWRLPPFLTHSVLGTGKTLVMFIVPTAFETRVSESAVDVIFEDRTDWSYPKGLNRQQIIDILVKDQKADDLDLIHLSDLDGIVSLEEAGLEESRADNADMRSDIKAYLPVWQEIIVDTIDGQLG